MDKHDLISGLELKNKQVSFWITVAEVDLQQDEACGWLVTQFEHDGKAFRAQVPVFFMGELDPKPFMQVVRVKPNLPGTAAA